MESVTAAIALGSNLGQSYQILTEAIVVLGRTPGIEVVQCSPLYQTAPMGPPQPDYLNACALLQVTHTPHGLLDILLTIERKFGRVRRERWGPRLLDLDLILYGQQIIETPVLQVPHPRMRERAFVLVPLADIAPHWLDPLTGQRIQTLATIVDRSGVLPLVTSSVTSAENSVVTSSVISSVMSLGSDLDELRLGQTKTGGQPERGSLEA